MTNGFTYRGNLLPGQLSVWSFTANSGDSMVVGMGATNGNLYPYLRIYGPNGALLSSYFAPNAAEVSARATNSGTFTVVAGNDDNGVNGGYGTFQLTANGLSDGLKDCVTVIFGANEHLSGVGGPPGTNFVLFTATNIATPIALWTPVLTNHFDEFGVFDYTNGFNPAERQRYFRLSYP